MGLRKVHRNIVRDHFADQSNLAGIFLGTDQGETKVLRSVDAFLILVGVTGRDVLLGCE